MNQNILLIILNQGSRDELMSLPGIGSVLADGLIAARPFESLEDAEAVNGISANILEQLEESVAEGEYGLTAKTESQEESLGESMPAEAVKALKEESQVDLEEPLIEDETENERTSIDEEPTPDEPAADEMMIEETADEELGAAEGEGQPSDQELEEPAEAAEKEEPVAEGAVSEEPKEESKPGVSPFILFLTSAFTALVTILLTLVVLAGINGTLRFATQSEYRALQREANNLNEALVTLQQELTGLSERVEALEGLNERMENLEGTQQQLTTDLKASNQRISEVQAELTTLEEEVKQQEERTQRFENFLVNLQALLSDLFEPQGAQP